MSSNELILFHSGTGGDAPAGLNGNASPPPPPASAPTENGLETPQGLATPVNENGINAKLPGFHHGAAAAAAASSGATPPHLPSVAALPMTPPENLASDLIEAVRVATSLR